MLSLVNRNPIVDGRLQDLIINKVVCVGRNYTSHARELNNPIPDSPLLFIKPNSTLCSFSDNLYLPSALGLVHHELEIAFLIGERLTFESTPSKVEKSVAGIGLALDLTLRDVQNQLKEKSHPWERAKCFPGACPLSEFVGRDKVDDLQNLRIQLRKNNKLQQQGSAAQMIFPVIDLIQEIAATFTLDPGDVVLTGTPSGVSALNHGDSLEAQLMVNKPLISAQCEIVRG